MKFNEIEELLSLVEYSLTGIATSPKATVPEAMGRVAMIFVHGELAAGTASRWDGLHVASGCTGPPFDLSVGCSEPLQAP